MEEKIWWHLTQILSYRKDLLDVIKPFMENLEYKGRTFNIHDPKHTSFLKSFTKYHLQLLVNYGIISSEKYKDLQPIEKKFRSFISIYESQLDQVSTKDQQILEKIIEGDKVDELQKLISEKENKMVFQQPFNEVQNMSFPILHYCIIHNALECFKYLLINGIDDPTKIMDDQQGIMFSYAIDKGDISPNNVSYGQVFLKRYEWDCMSLAIYFGNMEIIKILEQRGIEKGNNPTHLEAAILSYRNIIAEELIQEMKAKIELEEIKKAEEVKKETTVHTTQDNTFVQPNQTKKIFQQCLNDALFSSAKNNNILGVQLLLNNGAYVDSKAKTPSNYWRVLDYRIPLHYSLIFKSEEIAKILISKGANINAVIIHYPKRIKVL